MYITYLDKGSARPKTIQNLKNLIKRVTFIRQISVPSMFTCFEGSPLTLIIFSLLSTLTIFMCNSCRHPGELRRPDPHVFVRNELQLL